MKSLDDKKDSTCAQAHGGELPGRLLFKPLNLAEMRTSRKGSKDLSLQNEVDSSIQLLQEGALSLYRAHLVKNAEGTRPRALTANEVK